MEQKEKKKNKLRAWQEVDLHQMCSSEAGVSFLQEKLEERKRVDRSPNEECLKNYCYISFHFCVMKMGLT